jgi:hypothetical protein
MRHGRLFSPTLIAIAAAFSSAAYAKPGDHIRVGESVITPSVMNGIEAHSNLYLADGSSQSPEVSAMAWVLKPRLDVDTKGRVAIFDLGFGYGIKKFIDFYSDDDFHPENADQFANVNVDAALQLFPTSKVGGKLSDKFDNQAVAAELPTQTGSASANVVHTGNDLSGGLVIRPGSALTFEALGQFGYDNYEVPEVLLAGPTSAYNNRVQYGPVINASWRFLPKTSMVASFSYNFLRWENNIIESIGPDVEGSDIGSYIGKPDADAWRLTAGVTGQFTQKLAAAGTVGFGVVTYDEQSVLDDPLAATLAGSSSNELNTVGKDTFADDTTIGDGILVNLQVSYAPIRGQTLTAGYRKDFQDAVFTNYVAYNYVFFRYEGTFQNRLGLGGELSYRLDEFHGEVARGDQNLGVKASASYSITPWLSAGASGGWARRACTAVDCDTTYYSTQYDDFSGTLGMTFTY